LTINTIRAWLRGHVLSGHYPGCTPKVDPPRLKAKSALASLGTLPDPDDIGHARRRSIGRPSHGVSLRGLGSPEKLMCAGMGTGRVRHGRQVLLTGAAATYFFRRKHFWKICGAPQISEGPPTPNLKAAAVHPHERGCGWAAVPGAIPGRADGQTTNDFGHPTSRTWNHLGGPVGPAVQTFLYVRGPQKLCSFR